MVEKPKDPEKSYITEEDTVNLLHRSLFLPSLIDFNISVLMRVYVFLFLFGMFGLASSGPSHVSWCLLFSVKHLLNYPKQKRTGWPLLVYWFNGVFVFWALSGFFFFNCKIFLLFWCWEFFFGGLDLLSGFVLLINRYQAANVLQLLQEVAHSQDVKIDWNQLAEKTSTGISNAREYQMLWRHLAYREALVDKFDNGSQPLVCFPLFFFFFFPSWIVVCGVSCILLHNVLSW